MFLEKTPHNLLNPRFFNRLFPEARYVHVVRDPRAIAVSLLAQTWGPSDLAGTRECVAAYLETWQSALQFLRETGLPVLDLRIEDLTSVFHEGVGSVLTAAWVAAKVRVRIWVRRLPG